MRHADGIATTKDVNQSQHGCCRRASPQRALGRPGQPKPSTRAYMPGVQCVLSVDPFPFVLSSHTCVSPHVLATIQFATIPPADRLPPFCFLVLMQ